jgi:photosystem II stability/assembly factor-like uncharacterized protein
MKRLLIIFFLAIILPVSVIDLQAQWQQVNLGPAGGKVNSVAVIGTNVFAGTIAGINRSTNYGVSWSEVNSSLTLCFASIGSNIFAGTDAGVITSTDGGNTWTAPNVGMPYYITTFAVKDTILFAGTGQNGIFRSTNNGISWTAVNNGLGDFQNEVLALAVIGTNIYAGTASGLCLSTDNGNNWSTIVADNLTSLQFINCIAGTGSTIIVGTPGGILLSTDNGNAWGSANTGLSSGTSIFSILVNNSDFFIGTTSGVYVSTNSGESWTASSNGLPVSPSQVYFVTVGSNGAGGTNLYAATNSGVYISSNNGSNWTTANNGTVGTDILSFAVSGQYIYAAIQGSPIFVSTNYGSTWNAAADSGLGSERIQNLIFTNSNLYAFTDSGLFLSSNEGENWSLINGGIMDTVYPYDIIQSGSNLVVATYLGIYFSSNNGLNWNKASGFNPQSPAVMAKFSYNLLSESGDGISLSTDDGENWVELNGIPQNWGNFVGVVSINSILIAANEPAPIINSNPPPPGGIYSSTDNGKTWVMLTSTESPIYNSYIGALVVTGSDIFVVSENEVYRSTDNGNNFNNISGGLPDIGITAFSVNDSSIFVGTNSGIWKLLLSDIINSVKNSTLPSSPKSFVLRQNYPNPFNPSTVIQYQIPINGMVTLKVFDILGREIKTLVNEYKNQGTYTVLFDASKLSSGIYFYQIRSGNFISTKKMILMK